MNKKTIRRRFGDDTSVTLVRDSVIQQVCVSGADTWVEARGSVGAPLITVALKFIPVSQPAAPAPAPWPGFVVAVSAPIPLASPGAGPWCWVYLGLPQMPASPDFVREVETSIVA